MLFHRKEKPTAGKAPYKISDLKSLSFGRDPIHSILATFAQPERVQKIRERSAQLHLQVIRQSNKGDIPL